MLFIDLLVFVLHMVCEIWWETGRIKAGNNYYTPYHFRSHMRCTLELFRELQYAVRPHSDKTWSYRVDHCNSQERTDANCLFSILLSV